MCGIVGAALERGSVARLLVEALRVLEYRGYDSSGLGVLAPQGVLVRRRKGRLEELERELADGALDGLSIGVGHTRWATHGEPSDLNAHPHTDERGSLALVHNGIIENYQELRAELSARGVEFRSQTDTEVLSHLVGEAIAAGQDPFEALRASLLRVRGYYAVALVTRANGIPRLLCARAGPPLVVATTADAAYLASDPLALLAHTREVRFLEDGDIADLSPGRVRIVRLDGNEVVRPVKRIDWDPESTSKGGFAHYMLKEIHEQPDVLARTAFERIRLEQGDVDLGGGAFSDDALRALQRIQITACGTALHAGLIARYLIEGLAGLPVDIDYASELRYRRPPIAPGTLGLAISQSGETADTLAAMRTLRELGAPSIAICNSPGSTLVRESQGTILTQAGPEIGVASTKAFVAQVLAACLLAVRLGRARGSLPRERGQALLADLRALRPKLEMLVSAAAVARVQEIAARRVGSKGFLFLGRGINYPVALEGALKLKEISYMHAEGYPAGEMKHGPIALVEPSMTIVVISSAGSVAEKVLSNVEQVRARGGQVICVGSDRASLAIADDTIEVPACSEWLSPVLNVVPLQLFAYTCAALRGCDIDKPRNLAKSVTVE
jgi:glucosamine--fructose-6-phosphate aminotransferase (isomerizing)